MAPDSADAPPRWRSAALLLLLVLPLALYAPALSGAFVSDDHRFIPHNDRNLDRVLAAPWHAFTEPGTNATPSDPDIYRPLRTLSFALDRKAFGNDPTGYHVHAALAHGLVACLAFLLFAGTLARAGSARFGGAFAGALLFACHPLASEAVAWIASRSDLQVALAALATLLAARGVEVRSKGAAWLVLLALACGFAKESGVVVPALYLLEHRARTGRFTGAALAPFIALCAGAALYVVAWRFARPELLHGQVPFWGGSFATHLPYGLAGVARLLRLVFLPWPLNFQYEPYSFHPLAAVDLALAVVGIAAALLAIALGFARGPAGLGAGIAWFFVALLPAANVVLPMRTVLAERFAYLPLVGFGLAAGGIVAAARARVKASWLAAAVIALAGAAAASTLLRARDWRTQEALYRATAEDWPASASARMGLAQVARERGDAVDAERHYRAAAERARGDATLALRCRLGAGLALMDQRRFDDAAAEFAGVEQALRALPEQAPQRRELLEEASFQRGRALAEAGRILDAEEQLHALIDRSGDTAPALLVLGVLAERRLDPLAAQEYYTQALLLDPDFAPARLARARLFAHSAALRLEALRDVREVLARDPDNAAARALRDELERAP